MEIIPIDKSKIPYTFEIVLSNRVYTIALRYNIMYDFFTADLILNAETLVSQEKLVMRQFLFREVCEDKEHNINSNFPSELIFVDSEDRTIKRITYDNFGDTVNIYVVNRNEVLLNE